MPTQIRTSLVGTLSICLLAAHTSATTLTLNPQLTQKGPGLDYALVGVGLRESSGFIVNQLEAAGVIGRGPNSVLNAPLDLSNGGPMTETISVDIPGPIRSATLYWGGRGVLPGDSILQVDGIPNIGVLIGTEQTSSTQHSYCYRADITDYVNSIFTAPGLLSFEVSDPTPMDAFGFLDGASLLVIYDDPDASTSYEVSVFEGSDFAYAPRLPDEDGFTVPVDFPHAMSTLARPGKLGVVVGDCTDVRPDRVEVSGNANIVNQLNGSDGMQWDSDVYNITIPAGAATTTVEIVSPPEFGSSSDSLTWNLGVLRSPCAGRIGDFIWQDADNDGIQDAGEPGIGGVRLVLYQKLPGDVLLLLDDVMTTGAGFYEFAGLCAGDYQVEIDVATLPLDYDETQPNQGADDAIDSDFENGMVMVTLPTDNTVNLTIDGGFSPIGACCLTGGGCLRLTAFECAGVGLYQGDFRECDVNCPMEEMTGACCFADGTCVVMLEVDCTIAGGMFLGVGTECVTNPCPQPPGACCFDDGVCLFIPQANCISAGGVFLGVGVVCAPNPCPEPGACCFTNGACQDLLQGACIAAGGVFLGPDTDCSPNPCPQPGACCFLNGTCQVMLPADCSQAGGLFQGPATTCLPTNPCPQPGACCFADGTCIVVLQSMCNTMGGAFEGPGTLCTPNPCPQPGACCFNDGTCGQMLETQCNLIGGMFLGEGVLCSPNLCPQRGACCFDNGTCTFVLETFCDAAGGDFQAEGITCSPNPCPQPGACCFDNGTCVVQFEADCIAAGGMWEGDNTLCTPNPCPQPSACCFADGTCIVQLEDDCIAAGGIFQSPGTLCTPTTCPQPGACCFEDGTCIVQFETDCIAAGGIWEGDNTTCTPNPCPLPGACCFESGTCAVLQLDACIASGGTFFGAGTVCTPNPCPQPGACCFDDGSCQFVQEVECAALGGDFQDPGVLCTPNPCPQPGACCFEDGSCVFTLPADCIASGGVPQGDLISCSPNPCPQPGACCFDNGACVIQFEDDCIAAGGMWEGDNTTCTPNPCPQPGACCFDNGTCLFVQAVECGNLGGVFQAPGVLCTPNPCPQPGACCFEDGTCLFVLAVECANLGGDFQAPGVLCTPNPCPQPGACCFDDGSCVFVQATECALMGGVFQGEQVACGPGVCPQPGACCFDDGSCIEMLQDPCNILGGIFQGEGTTCTPNLCPQLGACCFDDGTCVELFDADCIAAGGLWSGEKTSCTPNVCPQIGACCFDDGSCIEMLVTDCIAAGGAFSGEATTCTPNDCPPPLKRGGPYQKGSLLIYPKIEVRWDASGNLVQDTFISLINDYPQDVQILAYFVQGDPPVFEGAWNDGGLTLIEPGWNWVDIGFTLTKNEPCFWSAVTGLPKGVTPWTILDPGNGMDLPGRPAPEGDGLPGDRVLRGFIVLWAVDMITGEEIRWDHLSGSATLVNYRQGAAWEYGADAHCVADMAIAHGQQTGTPGVINLDNIEYSIPYGILLMDFYSSGSEPFGNGIVVDTDLTLMPIGLDVRLFTDGPITTDALFEVWDQNEIKRSNTMRCITCWDQTLLSAYEAPNSFLKETLQTDKGKARIDGLANQDCDFDLHGPGGPGTQPDGVLDIVSESAAMTGVIAKHLLFPLMAEEATLNHTYAAASGTNLIGMGTESAVIRYNVEIQGPPPSVVEWPPQTHDGWAAWYQWYYDQMSNQEADLDAGN